MRVEDIIVLDRDEANRMLPYALICMTRYGAGWERTIVRKRFKEEFTPEEKKASEEIFRKSHSWFLVKGVPEEVKMRAKELALWVKLGDFCASI